MCAKCRIVGSCYYICYEHIGYDDDDDELFLWYG